MKQQECIYQLPVNKPENPVIIDLGCYLGYESLKLIKFYNPSLMISVDAVQELINVVENKSTLYPNWKTDCCIVSDITGVGSIMLHHSPSLGNNLCANRTGGTFERVLPTKRIVDIHPTPNIIKCDIESGEWVIWDQFLEIPSLDIIFLELHGGEDADAYNKIDRLGEKFNLRFYQYQQSQTEGIDLTIEMERHQWKNEKASYCHILAERK